MLLQHLLEVFARMTGGMLCHGFRGAHHHDLAALIAPIRTQINDPVGIKRLKFPLERTEAGLIPKMPR
jgi:hypothetical protein